MLVWSGPLLIAAAAGWVVLAERGTRGALIALVLLTAVDLGAYGMSYSVLGRTAPLPEYVAAIRQPPTADARVAVREVPGTPRVGDRMLLAGLARADGYAGLEPGKRNDYRQPRALQLAGVRWVLDSSPHDPQRRVWIELDSPAPRARLLTRTNDTLTADSTAPIWHVGKSEPHVALPRSHAGTAIVAVDRPGRLVITTAAPARQLLATTESFDSLWTARVDGRPAEIVRVDGDFLGCVVDGGKHHVELEFRPRCRDLGVLISVCGLGLLVLVAGWPLARSSHQV
jgi:hypothetical protein